MGRSAIRSTIEKWWDFDACKLQARGMPKGSRFYGIDILIVKWHFNTGDDVPRLRYHFGPDEVQIVKKLSRVGLGIWSLGIQNF